MSGVVPGSPQASTWALSAELWQTVEPLLAPSAKMGGAGRPRVDDRLCFAAVAYVAVTGASWRGVPPAIGVSRATAHRRWQEWNRTGVWTRMEDAIQVWLVAYNKGRASLPAVAEAQAGPESRSPSARRSSASRRCAV